MCEFYCWAEPPDYIFYCGEVLGETVSFIPQRTGQGANLELSREARWEEIRAMFSVHSIIIDLMDVDPLKIKDEKFQALKLL